MEFNSNKQLKGLFIVVLVGLVIFFAIVVWTALSYSLKFERLCSDIDNCPGQYCDRILIDSSGIPSADCVCPYGSGCAECELGYVDYDCSPKEEYKFYNMLFD